MRFLTTKSLRFEAVCIDLDGGVNCMLHIGGSNPRRYLVVQKFFLHNWAFVDPGLFKISEFYVTWCNIDYLSAIKFSLEILLLMAIHLLFVFGSMVWKSTLSKVDYKIKLNLINICILYIYSEYQIFIFDARPEASSLWIGKERTNIIMCVIGSNERKSKVWFELIRNCLHLKRERDEGESAT